VDFVWFIVNFKLTFASFWHNILYTVTVKKRSNFTPDNLFLRTLIEGDFTMSSFGQFQTRSRHYINWEVVLWVNPLWPHCHIKTAQQRTIKQQYGDWYTGRWYVGSYIWYSEKGTGRAAAPPSPLLTVPNVTAHPPTATDFMHINRCGTMIASAL